ncbi:hypothetical protein B0H13DRAFT_2086687, partial [Mycena leptocephala]
IRIQVPSVLLVRSVATLTKFTPDNPLQTVVLNLSVALKYRLPNLFVGQIISYLIAHAHSQIRINVRAIPRTRRVVVKLHSSQNPLLPVTVQDQIRLWEI